MKHILLALLVAGLFGCSSSKKHDHTDEVSDEAKAAIESAAEDLKNAASEAEETVQETAQETVETAQETVASATDGFGAYEGTEASKVTCTLNEDVRTITVLNGADGGCGVVYNKMGVDKTVAVAKNVMDYCSTTSDKIKGNLAAAGFNCQ